MNDTPGPDCIVVGAFDRHNFGDLLFPHIAVRMLACHDTAYAGVARRDLTGVGGVATVALAGLAATLHDAPVAVIHAGGEILSCSPWHAAAMLLPPEQAASAITQLEADAARRDDFILHTLGRNAATPYVAARDLFPHARAIVFAGVGGISLEQDEAMRADVSARLREADFVGVRDAFTFSLLRNEGVAAALMPDPAVLLRELFGPLLVERGGRGECLAMRQCFPAGYLAVQCSADFGDDATLDVLAEQIGLLSRRAGLGAVLFRAGAATWHDDPAVYERMLSRPAIGAARIFHSLDVFDICALIAGSAGYCGSSLHGRIVAMAYGLPRVNLCMPPCDEHGKTAAFAAAWDRQLPGAVAPSDLARAMLTALAMPDTTLREAGMLAATECRRAFDAIRALVA